MVWQDTKAKEALPESCDHALPSSCKLGPEMGGRSSYSIHAYSASPDSKSSGSAINTFWYVSLIHTSVFGLQNLHGGPVMNLFTKPKALLASCQMFNITLQRKTSVLKGQVWGLQLISDILDWLHSFVCAQHGNIEFLLRQLQFVVVDQKFPPKWKA